MDDPAAVTQDAQKDQDAGWVDVPPNPAPTPGAAAPTPDAGTPPPAAAAPNPETGWVDVPTEEQRAEQLQKEREQRYNAENPPQPPGKSVTGFLGNVLTSTGDLVGNTVKAVIPYDAWNDPNASVSDKIPLKHATDQLFDLFVGAGRDAAKRMGIDLPENQSADQAIEAARNYVQTRYGSWDNFTNSWYNDPAGMASDAWTFAHPMMTRAVRALIPKAAGKIPAFDPATATFEGDVPAFDPKSDTFDTRTRFQPGSAPKPPAPDLDAAVKQRAYDIAVKRGGAGTIPSREDWILAQQDVHMRPPEAPEVPPAKPAAAPTVETGDATAAAKANATKARVRDVVVRHLIKTAIGGVGGYALEQLTGNMVGSILSGGLTTAALEGLPALLKSEAGRQIMARLGPGSTAAARAAAVRDLVPALNALHKTQQQGPVDLSASPYLRAKGGLAPDPVLARIQRERLGLRGRTVKALQHN